MTIDMCSSGEDNEQSLLRPAFTRREHELLSTTQRNAPMGDLLRKYWVPALLSEEILEPDCPPVRAKLMNEKLVAFRDSDGNVGLLDEFCKHRGASLFNGRNADGGIQCVYHGWKFNVDGDCIENPTCPMLAGDSRVAQRAYPTHEEGGLIWAYLGEGHPPAVPNLGFMGLPDSHRQVRKVHHTCNWLQALEIDIDSSHVVYLHRGEVLQNQDIPAVATMLRETGPHFEVEEGDYGLLIAARRDATPGTYQWRITHWLTPWYTVIPTVGEGARGIHAWVPIDDVSCWIYTLAWHPRRPLTYEERNGTRGLTALFPELIPGTYIGKANKDNEFLIDRDAQKRGELWSGVEGIQEQDAAITSAMGPNSDITRETLVGTDGGVIATRRALLQAITDIENGKPPIGIEGKNFDQDPVTSELPRNADWLADAHATIAERTRREVPSDD